MENNRKEIEELGCKVAKCEEEYKSKAKNSLEYNNDLKTDLNTLSEQFKGTQSL